MVVSAICADICPLVYPLTTMAFGGVEGGLTAIFNFSGLPGRSSCSFPELYNDRYLLRCGFEHGTLADS